MPSGVMSSPPVNLQVKGRCESQEMWFVSLAKCPQGCPWPGNSVDAVFKDMKSSFPYPPHPLLLSSFLLLLLYLAFSLPGRLL